MNSNIEICHILRSDSKKSLPLVDRGEGIYLYDTAGKRYLDGSSGPVTCNIGHSGEEIAHALASQAKNVFYVYRKHFTSDSIEKLADLITEMAPEGLTRVFFVSSGSEASEMALKIARQYWLAQGQARKEQIVSRWLSYHGITLGALSMSGHLARRRDYTNMLLPFPKIPPPYCYRCPLNYTYPECNIECAYKLRETLQQYCEKYISAFIAEPIIGATGGAITPPPEYFEIIRKVCDEFDILLISDEVMTGFGRTGLNFGIDHWKVTPDIIVFGKGVSAGAYPLAGVIISEKIYRVLKSKIGRFSPGHTHSGTPLAGAVGLRVLEFLREKKLIGNVHRLGNYLMKKLISLFKYNIVGDIRGKGFLTGIEFVADRFTKEPFSFKEDEKVARMIAQKAFENGLIVYPGGGTVDGHRGDHILIAPPFIINKKGIDELISLLDKSIEEVEKDLL